MDINQLLKILAEKNIRLNVVDNQLNYTSPAGVITEELLSSIKQHKQELLDRFNRRLDSYITNYPLKKQHKKNSGFKLTFSQQRYWFLSSMEPESAAYNNCVAQRLKGALDVSILRRCFEEILKKHGVLQARVIEKDGEFWLINDESLHFEFEITDLRRDKDDLGQQALLRELEKQANTPFLLKSGPLVRLHLYRVDETEHVLQFIIHHILFDGWSLNVLYSELSTAYNTYKQGLALTDSELAFSFGDYAVWQHELFSTDVLERQSQFWLDQVKDLDPVEIPSDFPTPKTLDYSGSKERLWISPKLTAKIKRLCEQAGVTPFMVMLAAYMVLLSRYSGQSDICVGSPVTDRRHNTEAIIGLFHNTLVLRAIVKDEPFLEFLRRIKALCLQCFEHRDFPFEKLVEMVNPDRVMNRNPFFNVMITVQSINDNLPKLTSLTVTPIDVNRKSTLFDLFLNITDLGAEFNIELRYSTQLYTANTVVSMLQHFKNLLQDVVGKPDKKIPALTMLAANEIHRATREWNRTEKAFPDTVCLHELFERQAELSSSKTAVVDKGRVLTYQALNEASNRVAGFLVSNGVGVETKVGICIERSVDTPICMLGALKAGAAYVPLEPTYPAARLRRIIEDANLDLIVTQYQYMPLLDGCSAKVLCLGQNAETIDSFGSSNIDVFVQPDNLAYVIYTSGSTGQAKGVQISHRSVINFLMGVKRNIKYSEKDKWLSVTSLGFDISMLEIYAPLICGATLCIVDEDSKTDPRAFAQAIEQYSPSIIQATPASWQMLHDIGWRVPSDLCILCGGESWSESLIPTLASKRGVLWNMYGPTETTIWSALKQITDKDKRVSIGKPIDNTQLYVLDEFLNIVPVGVCGELYIGGVGLSRGYLNNASLTAEKFIPDLFSALAGSRLYRTGDWVKQLRDGDVEFISRIDQQVKVRGYRVELKEIESCLSRCEIVNSNIADVFRDGDGDSFLVAYVTLDNHAVEHMGDVGDYPKAAVSEWASVWNQAYAASTSRVNYLNTSGWINSYTECAFSYQEMEQWRDGIVDRIMFYKPARVLEIGCGTGLLVTQVAPLSESYLATDVSTEALTCVRRLIADCSDLSHVRLANCAADDLSIAGGETFDTVLLNSVIQYFPYLDYLTGVIQQWLERIDQGGILFIGDVRNYWLMDNFYADLAYYQNPTKSKKELKAAMQLLSLNDSELLVSPDYFLSLIEIVPSISSVEIKPKIGRCDNEMTLFRYDVVLHKGEGVNVDICNVTQWCKDINELQRVLSTHEFGTFGMSAIENTRLKRTNSVLAAMTSESQDNAEPISVNIHSDKRGDGLEYEELTAIGERFGYETEFSWANSDNSGRFDAVFTRSREGSRCVIDFGSAPRNAIKRSSGYSNNPIHKKMNKELQQYIQSYLKNILPSYMVPSRVVVMDLFPLSPNGKIDRKRLPRLFFDAAAQQKFCAPQTSIETKLCKIWENVLDIRQIGINDNYFELGGDSLKAMRIVNHIEDQFGINLPLKFIFEHSVLADQSRELESRM
jgi:amino acid adenylation domain-containing protein